MLESLVKFGNYAMVADIYRAQIVVVLTISSNGPFFSVTLSALEYDIPFEHSYCAVDLY